MAANQNAVVKVENYVAKEALKGYMNARLFSGLVTKDYNAEFEERGAKKGDEIFVKKPAQFRVRVGAKMRTQNIKETKIPVKLHEQQGVDFEFSVREATLDIDHGKSEYSQRFIRPAGSTLASNKDAEGMQIASIGAGYSVFCAAKGAAETDESYNKRIYKCFTDAKSLLNKFLAPKGVSERFAVVGSDVESALANSVSTLFNAQADITKAIKTAGIENVGVGGLTWGSSDLAYVHQVGTLGSTTLGAAIVPDYDNETQQITLSSVTGLNVGDTLVFTGSHFVNPETKARYSNVLRRKVLKIDAENSKVTVYSIRPAQLTIGGSTITNGNVDSSDDAIGGVTRDEMRMRIAMANVDVLPENGSAVTVDGTAGGFYLCCPVFQKKAIVLTSVDLVRPTKCEMSDVVRFDGMSMRFLEDYNIDSDQLPDRIDILADYTILYPEWIVDVEIPL